MNTSLQTPSRCAGILPLMLTMAVLACACTSTERTGSSEENVASARQALSCGTAGAGGDSAIDDKVPGALIVDLGTLPQTQGNALKPYGMVYDLVKNLKVPVLWAYSSSKTVNTDVDFTVDGRAFKGSSFVIPGAFVATAQATVNRWISQGVVVYGPTQGAFVPPTYFKRITGFPNIVLDPQNGAIAQAYLTAAGFPTFPVQYPTSLNVCQDMFILPHADPTWANHGNLKSFVSNGGFLWVGCHAVSILEELDGNGDSVPDMNFLSSIGLINYANHVNAYPPYDYDSTSLADPIMQFLGKVDGAVSGGSEAVYLPYRGGAWRSTTKVSISDPDQADVTAGRSPGLAAKLAYGRGYGLASSGVVMYQGSHNFSGTSADQIAAQRAFLNLVLWNASEKSVVVRASVPTRMLGATEISLTSTATSSGTIASYQWTSSCGGTFGTPTAANTTFTSPPAAIQNTACVIRLTATDNCNRVAFDARDVTILGLPDLAVTVTPSSLTPSVGGTLDYAITANDVGGLSTNNSNVTFTLPPASQYAVTSVVTSPTGITCVPRAAPNTNVYDCALGDLDGCVPVSIVVHGTVVGAGCFGVDVIGTTTSSDVDLGSNTASAQGCVTTTGNNPVLIKRVSPASPTTVNPGGTLTYTLTLLNAGGAQLDSIHIYDPYPAAATTYVAGSTSVTYRSYTTTIADSFPVNNYNGSTGQQAWAGAWTEINDGNGRPNKGNVRVKTTNCASSSCPNITAAVEGNGLQRALSLAGATGATLSFSYRVPTAKANQTAVVQVSGDGGTSFRTLATILLSTQVNTSTSVSYPLLAGELTGNARIRFVTTGTSNALFVPDDVSVLLQIAGTTRTSAGSAPVSGNSWDLTQNLDGQLSLRPGESMTATFRAKVNAGVPGGTLISNTANVKTTQTGSTVTNSNTVAVSTAASASIAPVASTQTVALNEDVVRGNLGITAPTDSDTTPVNLTVTVKRLPRSSQAVIYLADGVTPISINQSLTVAQLTSLTISGAPDFNGTADEFDYVVTDLQGNSSTGVATINFAAVNDAPVPYPDQANAQKGVAVIIDPPGTNDTDIDGLIDDSSCDLDPATAGLQSTLINAFGTWMLDTNTDSAGFGSVTYTPAAGFTGIAAISYSIGDDGTPLPAAISAAGSNCATAPIGGCITVRVNAPPVAAADSFSVRSIGGEFDVTANDTDSDGLVDVSALDLEPGTAGIQSTHLVTGGGTFTSLLNGRVRFVPIAGFFGTVSTNYTVDDFDGGTSNSVAISVTVIGCSGATDCDDGNDCTSDTCSAGSCVNSNLSTAAGCNDHNPGTKDDHCDGAGACSGTVYACAPGPCESTSVPNGSGCLGTPKIDGSACDDGSACTQTDTCQSGVCSGGNPVVCAAGDACHDSGICSPATGLCSPPAAKADGTICNDGDACTQTDRCQSGTCTGSNPVICAAVDQCHEAGTCLSATGVCSTPSMADGTICNDGNACTQTDRCQSGTCTGSNPVICAAVDQCHEAGTCLPATGACSTPSMADGTSCNDGNACTQTDRCQSGTCLGGNPLLCLEPQKPVCDSSTGQCGCNLNADCLAAAPICDSMQHTCHGCLVDGDCESTQFCNSESRSCVSKIANGTAIPTILGHNPNLIGQCNDSVAAAVCASGICDTSDNRCGYLNNDGPCTSSNGSVVCRSGICDVSDSKCGYADGNGPCTATNAGTVCRSGICSTGGLCLPPSACLVDANCATTQFCNTETNVCTAKLANESAIPSLSDHEPPLDGQCSQAVALAVCLSSVCNDRDDLCGYPNGDGPCTLDNASSVCRSAICDSVDSKCGLANLDGPCTLANAATVCRSKVCSVSGICQAEGTCIVDGDCASTQFCNSETFQCTAKLTNGAPLPTLGNHDPILSGSCSELVARAVCLSAVCDIADNQCGIANGDGPCLDSNAEEVCRSEVCDAKDSKCGFADGDGPCTKSNANVVCRSGACSVSGVCQAPSACTVDGDCEASQFCNTESRHCEPRLANGTPIPNIQGHSPALTGDCTAASGSVVCSSGVCDEADDRCGYANGDGSCGSGNVGTVCRSGACDELDGKCGYLDGSGPCTTGAVCRSGSCSVSGVCQAAGACTVDADCAASQFCNTETHACQPKLANGTSLPVVVGHVPALDGVCSPSEAAVVCASLVCDVGDSACGYTNGVGPCTAESAATVCRSSVCDSGDLKCGYANGKGPCTARDATNVCRSGSCSVSGVCQAPGACTVDADCSQTQFCNTAKRECTPKLANGAPLPTIAGHTPELDGVCSVAAAASVCLSSVCDLNDDRCGLANGDGLCSSTDGAIGCRSSVCSASDSKCGYADGEGPCSTVDAVAVCRSRRCSADGVCVSATGCHVDADCDSEQFCNTAGHLCAARLPNGAELPSIAGHSPTLDGICSSESGQVVCQSRVCDVTDNRCGLRDGSAPCASASVCRTGVCTNGVCGVPSSGTGGSSGSTVAMGGTTASSTVAMGGTTASSTVAMGGTTASSTVAMGGTTASSTVAMGGTTASSTVAMGGTTASSAVAMGGTTASSAVAMGGTSANATTPMGGAPGSTAAPMGGTLGDTKSAASGTSKTAALPEGDELSGGGCACAQAERRGSWPATALLLAGAALMLRARKGRKSDPVRPKGGQIPGASSDCEP